MSRPCRGPTAPAPRTAKQRRGVCFAFTTGSRLPADLRPQWMASATVGTAPPNPPSDDRKSSNPTVGVRRIGASTRSETRCSSGREAIASSQVTRNRCRSVDSVDRGADVRSAAAKQNSPCDAVHRGLARQPRVSARRVFPDRGTGRECEEGGGCGREPRGAVDQPDGACDLRSGAAYDGASPSRLAREWCWEQGGACAGEDERDDRLACGGLYGDLGRDADGGERLLEQDSG